MKNDFKKVAVSISFLLQEELFVMRKTGLTSGHWIGDADVVPPDNCSQLDTFEAVVTVLDE